MFTISKEFHFCASHQLTNLASNHQCARLHGHNYILVAVLAGEELNNVGFVRDYGELDKIKKHIDKHLEHRHLNDVFDFNPTAENMAKSLFEQFSQIYPELIAIRLSETLKTWAEYRPSPDPTKADNSPQIAS
jgi:6-pyruvoyltetrahydropterin/6-carboxytetrahydropterin synthase